MAAGAPIEAAFAVDARMYRVVQAAGAAKFSGRLEIGADGRPEAPPAARAEERAWAASVLDALHAVGMTGLEQLHFALGKPEPVHRRKRSGKGVRGKAAGASSAASDPAHPLDDMLRLGGRTVLGKPVRDALRAACTLALSEEAEGGEGVGDGYEGAGGSGSGSDTGRVCWYLAYGSNMDRARLRDRVGDCGGMRFVDSGMDPVVVSLPGWFTTFHKRASAGGGRGYATLEAAPARADDPTTEAILWPLTAAAINVLDSYEGVPDHYFRETWTVALPGAHSSSGRPVKATVYLHNRMKQHASGALPESSYLGYLLGGTAEGLSAPFVRWLEAHPQHGSTPSESDASPASRSASVAKARERDPLGRSLSEGKDADAHHLFVYGTLRPQAKGASWTKSFTRGATAQTATLPNSRLFVGQYPSVQLNVDRSQVVGDVLSWQTSSKFREKLAEADRIEGWPDFYHRAVRQVQLESGKKVLAFVYFDPAIEGFTPIPSGDFIVHQKSRG